MRLSSKKKASAVIWIILVLVTVLCGACVMPIREPLPEDTLEAFEDAMNVLDVNGMLECIDQSSTKAISAGTNIVLGIVGAITDIDLGIEADDIIAILPLLQEFVAVDMEDYPEVDFQVTETLISGDKATVYFYEASSGENGVVNMKKEGGEWKLTLGSRQVEREKADRIIIPGEEEAAESLASSEQNSWVMIEQFLSEQLGIELK